MTNMLESVVLEGTGEKARVSGYHIAGKTGTAKKVDPGSGVYTENEYFSSFGGFGPLRDPALVGFVVLDTPRGNVYYGGLVAAPVFARIMADALAYRRVPPDDDPWAARRDELKAKAEKESPRSAGKRPSAKDDERALPTRRPFWSRLRVRFPTCGERRRARLSVRWWRAAIAPASRAPASS